MRAQSVNLTSSFLNVWICRTLLFLLKSKFDVLFFGRVFDICYYAQLLFGGGLILLLCSECSIDFCGWIEANKWNEMLFVWIGLDWFVSSYCVNAHISLNKCSCSKAHFLTYYTFTYPFHKTAWCWWWCKWLGCTFSRSISSSSSSSSSMSGSMSSSVQLIIKWSVKNAGPALKSSTHVNTNHAKLNKSSNSNGRTQNVHIHAKQFKWISI